MFYFTIPNVIPVDAVQYVQRTQRVLVRRILLPFLVVVFYLLHQDVWFWRTARPLVFGFIPIGLFYHACYSVGASLLMWLLVKYAWPSELEAEAEQSTDKEPHR